MAVSIQPDRTEQRREVLYTSLFSKHWGLKACRPTPTSHSVTTVSSLYYSIASLPYTPPSSLTDMPMFT